MRAWARSMGMSQALPVAFQYSSSNATLAGRPSPGGHHSHRHQFHRRSRAATLSCA
jgi:hypothetical protein